jgi:hypothetical protein
VTNGFVLGVIVIAAILITFAVATLLLSMSRSACVP